MKEICDILGGRNILWPLLHIFRGPDPLPQYLRPYWLRLCFRQTSAVFSELASWLSAFQLNGHLMRFAIARARWSQISDCCSASSPVSCHLKGVPLDVRKLLSVKFTPLQIPSHDSLVVVTVIPEQHELTIECRWLNSW